ncbi:GspH/FimT family pseudopilin [Lysobacter sp. A3-1-A15]|uniref:GspH/FimT family pseudopilin n=1 Tax=Novilysobacter viscosus TaxID=3098602 RepID=UPI002ED91CF8
MQVIVSIAGRQPPTPVTARVRGFTLVELMVVVFIVGVLGTAVLLTAPGEGDVLARDAERLARHLVRAQEEAVLSTRDVQVVVTPQGYHAQRQSFDQWQPMDDGPFRAVDWSPGTKARFEGDGGQVSFRFDASGGVRVAAVDLQREGRRLRVLVGADARVRIDGNAR